MRHVVVLLFVCAAAGGEVVYQSDFAAGRSGFSVQWTGSGRLEGGLDPARPGPSGAPSWQTRATEVSRGTVGVGLAVGANRVWRISLRSRARIEAGHIAVALQCHDAAGQQVDWLGLGGIPASTDWVELRSLIELPASVARLNLLVLHQDFAGESWVADVRVETFVISAEQRARLTPAGPTRWGATQYLRSDDPSLRDTGAKLLMAAGVEHTRLGVDWRRSEPERGRFDFSRLDQQLAELERYGARAGVVYLHGTPQWASGKDVADMLPERRERGLPWTGRAFFPPRDWGDWERFVRELVTRFRGRVPAWEIMNEPDLWSEGFNGEYADYVEYLTRASQVIREVDPAAEVHLAAFVYDEWLPRILADGHAEAFDAVCIHPYHSQADGTLSRARKAQFKLLEHDAPKPLVVTEIGYQSGGWRAGPGVKETEEEKAAAGRVALAHLATVANLVCWYTSFERGNMYGLCRDDGDRYVPQPIYYDYGRLTGKLTDDTPLLAVVEAPDLVAVGQPAAVRLRLVNRGPAPLAVRFWPVGFHPNLGITLDQVRAAEWSGELAAGASHEVTLTLRPTPDAKGIYPLGLAGLSQSGNALALSTVEIMKAGEQ